MTECVFANRLPRPPIVGLAMTLVADVGLAMTLVSIVIASEAKRNVAICQKIASNVIASPSVAEEAMSIYFLHPIMNAVLGLISLCMGQINWSFQVHRFGLVKN
jgi:hypothetical protein